MFLFQDQDKLTMFPCTECEKTFSQKHHLKQHLEIHNGNRPYSCDVCMKAFIHGYDLKRHMRIHTGEKPYSCDVCNMEFAQNSRLKQHKKTHTGESLWKCEICEKNFIQSCELKMHLRIHTGEKPFNCDVCNKPFARPGDLVRHKRIHTDEKPYSCDICNVAFRDNASFWGHKKSKKHLKRLNGNDLLSSVPNNLEVYIKEEINEEDPLVNSEQYLICGEDFVKQELEDETDETHIRKASDTEFVENSFTSHDEELIPVNVECNVEIQEETDD